ncbi:type I-F CRISPR-associated protein Csy2 [Alkanindiges sp. WGS2144]|uniref:type I-F CRISPR-associated protein Csy2 n=1 Tax=Alkanindiges sp. WGS2144 TaxID=3366808 RepID=UPI0037535D5B
MSQFVLIPRLKIQNATLQTSGFVLGGAPLMAAAMFCHNLARQLGTQETGFLLIHHDRQDLGSMAYGRFMPAQRRGATFIGKKDYSSKNKYALSLQPTASCHLEVSLIIQFDRMRHLGRLIELVGRSRFAGGQVIESDEIKQLQHVGDALKTVGSGFVVQDRKALLQTYQQHYQVNRLQALVQLLAQKPEQRLPELSDVKLSWLAATALGYALLEPSTDQRGGIRQANEQDTTRHAYAEPLIGLIQYQTLRDFDLNDAEQLQSLFWHYHWPQPDVFLLQQHVN